MKFIQLKKDVFLKIETIFRIISDDGNKTAGYVEINPFIAVDTMIDGKFERYCLTFDNLELRDAGLHKLLVEIEGAKS